MFMPGAGPEIAKLQAPGASKSIHPLQNSLARRACIENCVGAVLGTRSTESSIQHSQNWIAVFLKAGRGWCS